MDFSGRERKKLFCNMGGKKLVDASYFSGIDSAQDGRSVAQADLDHDGTPELLVAMRDAPMFHVWSRRAGEPRGHVLALKVSGDGKGSSTDAIGAQVTATCGDRKVTRLVTAGTGFAAQDSHTMTIGLGACEKVDSLAVRWPSKLEKTFANVKTDELYEVSEDKLHNVPAYFTRASGATKASANVPVAPRPAPARSTARASTTSATTDATTPGATFLEALSKSTAHDARGASRAWTSSHDVVYVDFWASWCEACKRNQPAIDALSRRYSDRMDFVGVSMEPEDVDSVIADHATRTAYPLTGGKPLIAAATPLVGDKPALPTTMIVSKKSGAILWQGAGVPTISDLESSLDRAK